MHKNDNRYFMINMKFSPRVSVAVIIYGVEKYIERCARSLFEQTYPNIEYVFVNDCTPDKSIDLLMRVIEDYPERKKDIKIVHHEKNMGSACARNDAVKYCTSEFLTHVDSDDWLDPDMVNLMVEKQLQTHADIVSVGWIIHHFNGKVDFVDEPVHPDTHSMTLALLKPTQAPHVWGRLIRRSLYVDNNIKAVRGVNIAEDWCCIPKLTFYARKLAFVDNCLYHYNMENPSSVMFMASSYYRPDLCRQQMQAIDELKKFFVDKDRDYYEALLGIELRETQNYMNQCLQHSDRHFFYELAPRINKENEHLWDMLGNHNYLFIYIKKKYYLHKIYLYLRDLK